MKRNEILFLKKTISFFKNYSFSQLNRNRMYVDIFDLKVDKNGNLKSLTQKKKIDFINLIKNLQFFLQNDLFIEYFNISKKGIFKEIKDQETVDKVLFLLNNLLNKIDSKKELTKISEFALKHETHNINTKKIRMTNHYFKTKQTIELDVDLLVANSSNINIFKEKEIIIVENLYIFEQNKEEFLYYFKNYDFNYSNQIIIFGSGNKSASIFLNKLLQNAKKIYCFYDLDKNGFQMYSQFSKDLDNTRLMLPKRETIIKIQNSIKKNYNLSSNKENFQILPIDFKLTKLINKILKDTKIVPLFSMYEESFVSF